MGATLRADPDAKATEFGEDIEHLFVEAIGAGDAFEWNVQAAASHFASVVAEPGVIDGEYIVGDPDYVRRVLLEEPFDFIDDEERVAAAVGLSVDLMTAPAAI